MLLANYINPLCSIYTHTCIYRLRCRKNQHISDYGIIKNQVKKVDDD